MKHLVLFIAVCFAGSAFAQQTWENFDDERNVNYGFIHGAFNQSAANPDNTGINTSPKCAAYIRNSSEVWDVIVVDPPAVIDDLTPYVDGTKQMTMDVYSPAAGTTVQITFEDADTAEPGNHPTGRHSDYQATTSVAGEWETLTFTMIAEPDTTVPDDGVELMVILFDPGNQTGGTYYWDNLMGPEYPDPCENATQDHSIFEDYECQRNMTYDYVEGWITVMDNPETTGANTSAICAEYIRNDGLENAAFGGTMSQEVDLTTDNQAKIDIYDPSSPTPVLVSFQDGNGGVVIEKFITTTSTDEWVTYNMDLSSIPTPAASNITSWVMLVNPGFETADVLWLDNFKLDGFVATGIDEQAAAKANVAVFPNPFSQELQTTFELQAAEYVSITVRDITGRTVHQNRQKYGAGAQRWSWAASVDVPQGSYLITVQGESFTTTRNVLLQR